MSKTVKTINNSLFFASILDACVHVELTIADTFMYGFVRFWIQFPFFVLFPGVCVVCC